VSVAQPETIIKVVKATTSSEEGHDEDAQRGERHLRCQEAGTQ